MTTLHEAARMALEALDHFDDVGKTEATITALRAALAAEPEREPVAWMYPRAYGSGVGFVRPADYIDEDGNLVQAVPLYTSPAQPPGWVAVPVEPTEQQMDAGESAFLRNSSIGTTWAEHTSTVYRAMLAAAPKVTP